MISFVAFGDELEKISVAKWREVLRAGGEGAKRLRSAGAVSGVRSGRMGMSMPQAPRSRMKGQVRASQEVYPYGDAGMRTRQQAKLRTRIQETGDMYPGG